jgi:hypothetical protein
VSKGKHARRFMPVASYHPPIVDTTLDIGKKLEITPKGPADPMWDGFLARLGATDNFRRRALSKGQRKLLLVGYAGGWADLADYVAEGLKSRLPGAENLSVWLGEQFPDKEPDELVAMAASILSGVLVTEEAEDAGAN